jgi:hypothetical protein
VWTGGGKWGYLGLKNKAFGTNADQKNSQDCSSALAYLLKNYTSFFEQMASKIGRSVVSYPVRVRVKDYYKFSCFFCMYKCTYVN